MELNDILLLLGGLALFLYGMQMMGNGLETAAGNKMKSILEKLTSNRIKGVLVGSNPVVFGDNRHGRRVCKLWIDDIESGCMGNYGCQYRYDDYRTADRT